MENKYLGLYLPFLFLLLLLIFIWQFVAIDNTQYPSGRELLG